MNGNQRAPNSLFCVHEIFKKLIFFISSDTFIYVVDPTIEICDWRILHCVHCRFYKFKNSRDLSGD